uniref:Uncharacterized protein n=1 Tax=Timema shepardi TaxID=629360 RepID=A0A7R9G440_TIMSH|nr:unnamed protein product [Timema shepardi]
MYLYYIKYLMVVISCCICGVLSDNSTEDSVSSGLRMVMRTYHTCEQTQDTLACLKMRALKFADRLLQSQQLPITDGMVLVKTSQDEVGRGLGEHLKEVDEEGIPQDPRSRHDKLDGLLLDRAVRFLKTHSLQLNMPRYLADSRQLQGDDLVNQGRQKIKKYGGMLMMGAMMKAGMMMLGMGGVSMLAGKALIVAKIALVLAVVLGLGKLLGGGGDGGKTTYEVIKTPHVSHAHTHSSSHEYGGGSDGGGGGDYGYYESGGGGGHYARSLDDFHSHLLAYNGQIPRLEDPTNVEHALIPDSLAQS